eukprot:scaffold81093_cov23-Tisochrysis_lutea.AAC.1
MWWYVADRRGTSAHATREAAMLNAMHNMEEVYRFGPRQRTARRLSHVASPPQMHENCAVGDSSSFLVQGLLSSPASRAPHQYFADSGGSGAHSGKTCEKCDLPVGVLQLELHDSV